LGILEIQTASEIITEAADKDANIIIGAIIDESLGDEIQVTVIATGFEGKNMPRIDRPASIFGSNEGKVIFVAMR
jgi:cell division protein FtsZ